MARKALVIDRPVIRVSANSLIEGGLFFDMRVYGVLPGCRKKVMLSFGPMARYVWFRPLFGHSGAASVSPEDFLRMVDAAPVVSCEHSPVVVTPEIAAKAKASVASTADCPAIHAACHPDYRPAFDAVVIGA